MPDSHLPPASASRCRYYGTSAAELGPDRNIGLLIKQVHILLHKVIDQQVCPLGLTANQWRPLLLIHKKGVDTPAGLARAMSIDTGAATRMLDRLEAKNFLYRERSPEDRRVVRIRLTENGQDVATRILPAIAESLNIHLQGFSKDEIHMLLALLKRMIVNGEHFLEHAPTAQTDT